MRLIVHLMILIALLLLSACAISDLSMMQTAVPTGGGAVKASAYMGNGMNLYPTQDFREIYNAIAASDTVDYFLSLSHQKIGFIGEKKEKHQLVVYVLTLGLPMKQTL